MVLVFSATALRTYVLGDVPEGISKLLVRGGVAVPALNWATGMLAINVMGRLSADI
jgi:hypothetical protein